MMQGSLRGGIVEAWRAPRLGASVKKMAVALRGLAWGWLVYLVVGYLAHLVAGDTPASVWRSDYLFPLPPGAGLLPGLLWHAGLAAGLLLVLTAATGVAKITYRELKGDDFYGASDAWRFALAHARSTIGTPFLLGLLLIGVVFGLSLLGWIGRIPELGPFLVGLSAPLGVVVALAGVLLLLALLTGLLFIPVVVGTTGEDPVEGVIQIFGLIFALPWRTAAGAVVVALSTAVATWLGASLLYSTLGFFADAVASAMGEGFWRVAGAALHFLPLSCPLFAEPSRWFFALPPIAAGVPLPGPFPTAPGALLGALLSGATLLLLTGVVAAYAVSSLAGGLTALYLDLRRRKDGENLLEWPDEIDELEDQLAREGAAGRAEPEGM
jgi:hypothetical protein